MEEIDSFGQNPKEQLHFFVKPNLSKKERNVFGKNKIKTRIVLIAELTKDCVLWFEQRNWKIFFFILFRKAAYLSNEKEIYGFGKNKIKTRIVWTAELKEFPFYPGSDAAVL